MATGRVTYRIDHAAGRIRTHCAGEVLVPDVEAHFRALEAEPELPEVLDVLLDLREMTTLPTGEQIHAAAAQVERLHRMVSWGACAVVAEDDARFGMGRVFATLVEPPFRRAEVFRDVASAEAWLDAAALPTDAGGGARR